MQTVINTNISAYPLLARGKVRDIYSVDDKTLLIITTDRLSAFDVVLNEPIPMKGVVLNSLTLFWMKRFSTFLPNHLLTSDVRNFPSTLSAYSDLLEGRAVLVRKASPLPIECIVRGYLSGSAWQEYQKSGTVCGYQLPAGLRESAELPKPLFTPSTKAAQGEHDENITLAQTRQLLGQECADLVAETALRLYTDARDYAKSRGILIADTKFEFGWIEGKLHLIDEVLTPDSSRFWPVAEYTPGQSQKSFDKQYLRDWLAKQQWNKQPPAPHLPQDVLEMTAHKYQEAYTRLTGINL